MKKLTRKALLILGICLMMVSPTFAMVDEMIENNCQLTVNFFGLVKVWKGSKTMLGEDMYGNQYTYTIGCGEDGGSWDWFWE